MTFSKILERQRRELFTQTCSRPSTFSPSPVSEFIDFKTWIHQSCWSTKKKVPLPIFTIKISSSSVHNKTIQLYIHFQKNQVHWILVYDPSSLSSQWLFFHPVLGNGYYHFVSHDKQKVPDPFVCQSDIVGLCSTTWVYVPTMTVSLFPFFHPSFVSKNESLPLLLSSNITMDTLFYKEKKIRKRNVYNFLYTFIHQDILPILSSLFFKKTEKLRKIRRTSQWFRDIATETLFRFFRKEKGRLNQWIRFVFQKGNTCIPFAGKKVSSEVQHTICSLRTQCYATTQMIHYFFGNPTSILPSLTSPYFFIPFSHFPFTLAHLSTFCKEDNNLMNIEIGIGATPWGFPGHVLNIIILWTKKGPPTIYWIQSYIYHYTIQWKEISVQECEDLLTLYYLLFFSPQRSFYFLPYENEVWKQLTDVDLVSYTGSSLVGTPKPMTCSFQWGLQKERDLKTSFIIKYLSLLEQAYTKCEQASSSTKSLIVEKDIQDTFGPSMTLSTVKKMIESCRQRVLFFLQKNS